MNIFNFFGNRNKKIKPENKEEVCDKRVIDIKRQSSPSQCNTGKAQTNVLKKENVKSLTTTSNVLYNPLIITEGTPNNDQFIEIRKQLNKDIKNISSTLINSEEQYLKLGFELVNSYYEKFGHVPMFVIDEISKKFDKKIEDKRSRLYYPYEILKEKLLRRLHYNWIIKEIKRFTEAERESMSAYVVPTNYGPSVRFCMKLGGRSTYMPLCLGASVGVGEPVDLEKAEILILSYPNEDSAWVIRI
jgi:hypothetical protein